MLKSMNKKDEGEASHHIEVIKKEEKFESKPDPYTFKAKSPLGTVVGKKPLLVSSEMKTDEKAKGNVELQGIIQKLESAIHRSASPICSLDLGHSEEIRNLLSSKSQQSETISLLLCEETVPGSPATVPSKVPLSDIDRSPSSSSGGSVHPTMPSQSSNYMKLSIVKLKSERGSVTSSGSNTNNNSDNSPRDSNDDQSDNDRNGELIR
jgi:hypothetical protein